MGFAAKHLIIHVVFLVCLLLATTEMEIADGRMCESQSHRFKGPCLSDTNCANVCQTEGFEGGKCHGTRQRCFCTKPCLLQATTEMEIAYGRMCESQSHRFKGPCLNDTNCANVCQTEGFKGGKCHGTRQRCFCTKSCKRPLP